MTLPLALLVCFYLGADPSPLPCRFTEAPPKIDGDGADSCWRTAAFAPAFSLPASDKPAPMQTRVRYLWDREYLYFLAECDDLDLLTSTRQHNGKLWLADAVEFFYKPSRKHAGYYEFQVNPAGTTLELFLPDQTTGGYDTHIGKATFFWNTAVAVRGTVDSHADRDTGYTVEGRIPWTDLLFTGGRPNPGDRWQFLATRCDRTTGKPDTELSASARLSKPDFHAHAEWPELEFIGPPTQPTSFGHAPPHHVVGTPDPPPPFAVERAYPTLPMEFPIVGRLQPNSSEFWFVEEAGAYGPSTLKAATLGPTVRTARTLIPANQATVHYDICFHPKFAANGFVYLGLNEPDEKNVRKTRIKRYRCDPAKRFAFDANTESVVIDWPSNGHNGGAICFGGDGYMYVTSGDGTADSDGDIVGQDLSKLNSKVLRIDVDSAPSGYKIPQDNPFVTLANARPETWCYGMRNPWRISSDSVSGQIWVGQNGQDQWEQAYLIAKAANYGWSIQEGSHPFYVNRKRGAHPIAPPTVEHPHSEARSITGGLVYRGTKFAELVGAYLYGDYSTGRVWAVKHDGKSILWHREIASTRLQITSFAEGPDREPLISDHRGEGKGGFYRLVPRPADNAVFPRTLAATGLFADVRTQTPIAGAVPYAVNVPFWSDGARKDRFFVLPPGGKIDYARRKGWNFPPGTVVVKSFYLETAAKPHAWLETRLLVNNAGEWLGYSYRPNADGSDGALVPAAGADIALAGAVNGLKSWRVPSRTECMVCHTRAANYVLGLCELQTNCPCPAGASPAPSNSGDSQLARLESAGLLNASWADDAKAALKAELRPAGKSDAEIDAYLAARAVPNQQAAANSSLLPLAPRLLQKLVPLDSPNASVEAKAKSYLHANCAYCHIEAGGGNARMELEFTTPLAGMRVLDVPPLHDGFKLPNARLVASGHPDRSVVVRRVSQRGRGTMPPLASVLPDPVAAQLLSDWISSLPPAKR